jgi:hypothetical protein
MDDYQTEESQTGRKEDDHYMALDQSRDDSEMSDG